MPEEMMDSVEDQDSQDFEDAFNESVGGEKKADNENADVGGEPQKDLQSGTAGLDSESDKVKPDAPPAGTPADTDVNFWKSKVDELEAALKKEKQRTSSWDGRIKAANDKNKELEAKIDKLTDALAKKELDAESEKAAEEEKTDEEMLDMFRKGFPELADVVDVLERKINKVKVTQAKAEPEKPKEEPADVATPEPTSQQSAASDDDGPTEHYKTIQKAHNDVDEITSTGVLRTWIAQQPEYIQDHLEDIYTGQNGQGSARQVIDMITQFKEQTGWKSQLAQRTSAKRKADKLNSMLDTGGQSPGAPAGEPDKNDFEGTAKEIGL